MIAPSSPTAHPTAPSGVNRNAFNAYVGNAIRLFDAVSPAI
jgi:hypothetical protein